MNLKYLWEKLKYIKSKIHIKQLWEGFKSLRFTDRGYYLSNISLLISIPLLVVLYIICINVTLDEDKITLKIISAAVIAFPLISFSFSLLQDLVESFEKILKHTAIKLIGSLFIFLFSTYCLIKANKEIKEFFGIDSSFLPFTTSLLFIWNIFIKSVNFILEISLLIIITILVIAILKIFSHFTITPRKRLFNIFTFGKINWENTTRFNLFNLFTIKKIQKITSDNIERWTLRLSGACCLLLSCAFFLSTTNFISNKMLPDIKFKIRKPDDREVKIQKIGIYVDFNKNHHCNNPELKDKRVVFLENNLVLTTSNSKKGSKASKDAEAPPYHKNFEIQKCLVIDKHKEKSPSK